MPSDENQAYLYKDGVGILNTYEVQPGVCVLPVAEDPPTDPNQLATWSPVVVLRLHAPYRIRRVQYRTPTKQQNPPVVPTPDDVGAFVFTGGSLGFTNQLNMSLGSFDWTVETDYTFVENCVSRTKDGFILGSPPWTWITDQQNSQIYLGAVLVGAALDGPQGAILQGGPAAMTGWYMGRQIAPYLNGDDSSTWGYNAPAFFPGQLFSTDLVNGGPAPATSGNSLSSG